MERLNPLDASFLYFEDGVSHMHIGSCALFEGPAPEYRSVFEIVEAKLPRVPRYRQIVRCVPLQLGPPVWVDDPHFRLDYHVRHTSLPAPGGPTELRQLMGRLMSRELDRRRPLWEMWMVEGLEDGKWALITKVHHCMVDGVAGNDLLAAVFDVERDPAPAEPVAAWEPSPAPSALGLAVGAAWSLAMSPYEQLRAARRMLRVPRRALTSLGETAAGICSYVGRLRPTPRTSLVGSIGPDRVWTWASADLDALKAVRRAFGGTINDVVLAVVTGGLREMLVARGEPVDRLTVRSLVPVSVRSEAERGQWGNRVSAMFADLPVAVEEPRARLAAVREQMEALKRSHQTMAGEALTALGEHTPFASMALVERAAMQVLRRLPQHSINTVTTNFAGPQSPLYVAGREMLAYLPFVPIAPGVRVGVAIVSYHGRIVFGVTGDYDSVDDLDVLADAIEDGIEELLKLTVPG